MLGCVCLLDVTILKRGVRNTTFLFRDTCHCGTIFDSGLQGIDYCYLRCVLLEGRSLIFQVPTTSVSHDYVARVSDPHAQCHSCPILDSTVKYIVSFDISFFRFRQLPNGSACATIRLVERIFRSSSWSFTSSQRYR